MSNHPDSLNSLTERAKQGACQPAIGRDKELSALKRMILDQRPIHPLLLGPPGVGKTQLVQSLALELLSDAPTLEIFELDQTSFRSETSYIGQIESKLKGVLDFLKQPGKVVFIDEFHDFIGTGAHTGKPTGVEQQLKPALTAGSIRLIAATTKDEFNRFVAGDAALGRRFQSVELGELSPEATFAVLKHMNASAQIAGQTAFSDGVLQRIVERSSQKYPRVANPARALKVYSELQFAFDQDPSAQKGVQLSRPPLEALATAAAILDKCHDFGQISQELKKLFKGDPSSPLPDSAATEKLDEIVGADS